MKVWMEPGEQFNCFLAEQADRLPLFIPAALFPFPGAYSSHMGYCGNSSACAYLDNIRLYNKKDSRLISRSRLYKLRYGGIMQLFYGFC